MNLDFVQTMKHSPIRNYAIPGLTSWLIGAPSDAGTVRLFESEREHPETITPHSHRFDFQCVVLAGNVRNVLWRECSSKDGDFYAKSQLVYSGAPGAYEKVDLDYIRRYYRDETTYEAGSTYGMRAEAIHSIFFSRGAKVLFLEGPKKTDRNVVLEPWCGSERVPTFEVRPWMFQRGAAP